tara:strand:- start:1283 stop:2497 length:1215 start_codon:yes stop_codon:yes gene_type:complete
MARFSQSFLRSLTQPSFQEGLFTAARGIGETPGLLRQQQQQREEMEKLRGMGSVERAEFMAGRARTPEELMRAEASKTAAVKQSSLESLRGLEAARQAAETNEEKLRIENIMSRVAVQAGVDPSTITGRTQEEQDDALRRENARVSAQLNKINLETKQREQQEDALQEAYFAVPEGSREAFEKNLIDSGFASVIQDIKEEKLRKETANLNYTNALQKKQDVDAQKKTALATKELESSIDNSNIDKALKTNLKERLSMIKQPNFEAGETWNSGEKENAIREFNAINDLLSRAVVSQSNEKRRLADRISRLKDGAAKYVPSETAIKSFQGRFLAGGGTGARVDREEAVQMARQQALAPLLAEIEILEQQLGQLNTTNVDSDSDESNDVDEEGAQTVGRFTVKVEGS